MPDARSSISTTPAAQAGLQLELKQDRLPVTKIHVNAQERRADAHPIATRVDQMSVSDQAIGPFHPVGPGIQVIARDRIVPV